VVALVTGAGGFIGGHVVRRLESAGHDVAKAGRPDLEIPSAAFGALVERTAPELVIHCAAPASVAGSIADPAGDRQGSVGVLEAVLGILAGLPEPPRLVLVGSAAVYGQPESLPIGEDHPLSPVSPYGAHRVECEALLGRGEVPSVSLRVFSAYGEGLRRQVLWDICRKAVEESAVELAGTGRETRDFVHASDIAEAVAAVSEGAAFEGEAYNVGTGEATAISELAETLVSSLGGETPVSFSGRSRPGDPDRWQADPARLMALGWRPEVELGPGAAAYARWARTELARDSAPAAATASRSRTRRSGGAQSR
jgi:UDP-glucose 4-epimerase